MSSWRPAEKLRDPQPFPGLIGCEPHSPSPSSDSTPTCPTLASPAACTVGLRHATIRYAAQQMATLQQPNATE
jgi:hypothetical protein